MADDEHRGGHLAEERLDRLAGGDVEVVRGLVEEEDVRRVDPEQRELEARALPPDKVATSFSDVVAAEEEAAR